MADTKFISDGYTYLAIPEEWLCLYHKLLYYLADFGEVALKDCETSCSGKNKNILKCWGMFQSAIAAKSLGKDKLANTLIKYVDAQLELIYKNSDKDMFSGGFIFPIDENGYVKGLNSCANSIEFYVHGPLEPVEVVDDFTFEPGKLYARVFGNQSAKRNFFIEENDLIVESDLTV